MGNMENKELLRHTRLFLKIDDEQFTDLLSHVTEVRFPPGRTIIHEGETADYLYIIKEGVLQVFTTNPKNERVILARLEKGAYVGEQALIQPTPGKRNASARTLTSVTLLKIDHSSFLKVLEKDSELKKELKSIGFKQLISKLQALETEFDIAQYLLEDKESFETKSFKAGETIINQGEQPNGAFLLLTGNVEVFKDGNLICTTTPGYLIGELSLIINQPRQATVKAQGDVSTYFIPTDKFKELYQIRPKLKEITDTLRHVYQTPQRGEVVQFIGRFLNMPATITKFSLKSGREIVASTVIGKNMNSIRDTDIKNPEHVAYENKSIYRELQFIQDRLVGVTAYGEWSTLKELYSRVLENEKITKEELDLFSSTGEIRSETNTTIVPKDDNEIICNCMWISKKTIVDCIEEGYNTVDQIEEKTCAGMICWACIPAIQSMLKSKTK